MSLLVCSCFYIWQIYRVPAGLELRSWFCVNFGCSLIVLWQIAIVIGTIVLGKKFVSKQSALRLRPHAAGHRLGRGAWSGRRAGTDRSILCSAEA